MPLRSGPVTARISGRRELENHLSNASAAAPLHAMVRWLSILLRESIFRFDGRQAFRLAADLSRPILTSRQR